MKKELDIGKRFKNIPEFKIRFVSQNLFIKMSINAQNKKMILRPTFQIIFLKLIRLVFFLFFCKIVVLSVFCF